MTDIFNITQCNVAQLIAESNRFLFQVLLIHVTTCIIEGKKEIFTETLFKSLLITAMAIVMYHIFFRKIVEPKLEKMKTVCSRDLREKRRKLIKANQRDPLRPKYRKRLDRKIKEYDSDSTYEIETEGTEETDTESVETVEAEVKSRESSRATHSTSQQSQQSQRSQRSQRSQPKRSRRSNGFRRSRHHGSPSEYGRSHEFRSDTRATLVTNEVDTDEGFVYRY